ncbi:MAG TPA: efflux RND transporter periplasmic adaptor subunit [Thermoanaerobaculia bacterium]|nr:efflux RND transporter periplasmic adaptor subunit [Thermoanaerobaculia bacterium]
MRKIPLLVAVFALAALRCGAPASGSPRPAGGKLTRGDLVDVVTLTGELQASRGITITVPRMENWQTTIRWLIDDGSRVKRGDRVVELDNTAVSATLDQKRAALQSAEHELAESRARMNADLLEKRFELDRKRADMEKARLNTEVPASVISAKELRDRQLAFERATNEAEKAKTSLDSATRGTAADTRNLELAVEAAKRELEYAQHSIDSLTLTAPEDGLVLVSDAAFEPRRLQVGDRAWVSMSLARIPDLSSMQVVAMLSDVDDGAVQAGDRATVVVDAYPARRYEGKVVSIAPVAQELARQSLRRGFRTIIKLDRLDDTLLHPGYSVQVSISRVLRRNALLVPRELIDMSGAKPKVASREVKLGPCNSKACVEEER